MGNCQYSHIRAELFAKGILNDGVRLVVNRRSRFRLVLTALACVRILQRTHLHRG
jgi:hypothetical protein